MSKLFKIAWKNLIHRPINSGLCICLLMFGISIISLLILLQNQLEEKFERDLKNIDVVLGAKGSPLQLVLSSVYHLDSPTGNISYSEAQKVINNPQVAEAIPLAYGDSFLGYRILGTTKQILKKYEAEFQKGSAFVEPMQVNLGANVAKTSNLNIGDTFHGIHGGNESGHVHNTHRYKVAGIMKKNNSVLDNLILTPIESVWQVHHTTGTSENDEPSKLKHENNIRESNKDLIQKEEHKEVFREITAVLLKYKTNRALMSIPAYINKQTNMQAVLPNLEINRLFHILGIGTITLKWIAYGIILMAGFSLFFSLYGRLRERQYELALMRSLGFKTRDLFILIVMEGLYLVTLGYILGWLLSRLGLIVINSEAANDYNLHFSSAWSSEEIGLLMLTIFVGVISSIIPAWKAMRTDISNTLLNT